MYVLDVMCARGIHYINVIVCILHFNSAQHYRTSAGDCKKVVVIYLTIIMLYIYLLKLLFVHDIPGTRCA